MYIPQPRIFKLEKFTSNFFETTSATATATYSTYFPRSLYPLNYGSYNQSVSNMKIIDNIGLIDTGSYFKLPTGKFKVKLEVLQRHPVAETAFFENLKGLFWKNSDATAQNVNVNKTLTEVRDTGETDKTGNTIISITAECHIEVTSGISNSIELGMTLSGSKTLSYPYGNVYKYVTTIEQLDSNTTYFNIAQDN